MFRGLLTLSLFSMVLSTLSFGKWEQKKHAHQEPPPVRLVATMAHQEEDEKEFECVESEGGWRPQSKKFRRPLGSSPTRDKNLCEKAVEVSKNGLVCSYTGLGWKPTNGSGSTEMRRDYGYFGSSADFRKCILATEFSTPDMVCSCGSGGCETSSQSQPGERWYTNHPSGRNGTTGNSYPSVEACVTDSNPDYLKPKEEKKPEKPEKIDEDEKKEEPEPKKEAINGFECVEVKGGWKPQSTKYKKPLGKSAIKKEEDCEKAIDSAKHNLVCTYSAKLGWKPTRSSGKTELNAEFGTFGTSASLGKCLFATENSERDRICSCGSADCYSSTKTVVGEKWYATHPNGKKKNKVEGPFATVRACVNGDDSVPIKKAEDKVHATSRKTGNYDISQHCASCHTGSDNQTGFTLPDEVGNFKNWNARVDNGDEEAKEQIKKLYTYLLDKKSMPPKEGTKHENFLEDKKTKPFLTQLAKLHEKITGISNGGTGNSDLASNAVQVLPQAKLDEYRAMLPKVENQQIQKIFEDPNTLFYDEQSLPSGYQDPSGPGAFGVRTSKQITTIGPAPYLDENKRLKIFGHAFGMQNNKNAKMFHFLNLPKDANGNLKKIRVFKINRHDVYDNEDLWYWEFPVGTVSGQVVYELDSQGKPYALDVSIREKDKLKSPHFADVLRAAPFSGGLKKKLESLTSDSEVGSESQLVLNKLTNESKLIPIEITNDGMPDGNFAAQGATEILPHMSEDLVKKLLEEPFKSSLGAVWNEDGALKAFAATTHDEFGIVPKDNKRGVLPVNRQSCNKCHDSVNTPLRDFYKGPQYSALRSRSIDLYGNTPGNDGNLRWHPFDPSYFQNFALDNTGYQDNRRINPKLRPILDIEF